MNVVYTCIFGEGYALREPKAAQAGWRYVLLTDREDIEPKVYERILLPPTSAPVLSSRQVKICGGLTMLQLLKEIPDVLVYHDARFVAPPNLDAFVRTVPSVDVVVMEHNKRTTIAQEAKHVVRKEIEVEVVVEATLARIRAMGYNPKDPKLGLYAPGVMVRRYTSEAMGRFEMTWFKLLRTGSWRDQLSLPVALASSGVRFAALPFHATYELWMGRA